MSNTQYLKLVQPGCTWEELNMEFPFQGLLTLNHRPDFNSAVYLPFLKDGKTVDWDGLFKQCAAVYDAGGVPVINADTGWAMFLGPKFKAMIARVVRKRFPGKRLVIALTIPWDPESEIDVNRLNEALDGVPADQDVRYMVMMNPKLVALREQKLVDAYQQIADILPQQFFAHELPEEFVPTLRELSPFEWLGVAKIDAVMGIKISSLKKPSFMRRTLLARELRSNGFNVKVMCGNDWGLVEALLYGEHFLIGAGSIFQNWYKRAFELYADGDARAVAVFTELQNIANIQFFSEDGQVGKYKDTTRVFLQRLRMIAHDSALPEGLPDSDKRDSELNNMVVGIAMDRVKTVMEGLIGCEPVDFAAIDAVLNNGVSNDEATSDCDPSMPLQE